MRYRGRILLVGEGGSGIEAEIELIDDVVTLRTRNELLGRWAVADVSLRPENGISFRLMFGNEPLVFVPAILDRFATELVPRLRPLPDPQRSFTARQVEKTRERARRVASVVPRLDPRLVSKAEQPVKKWLSDRSGKKTVTVKGSTMFYMESGEGPPVVFIHGGVASASIWNQVTPHVRDGHRTIAVDPIGTGRSTRFHDPGPGSYGWEEHTTYLDGFLGQVVGDEPVVLVNHGWGSLIGCEWARRNPGRVRGICNIEAVLRPYIWSDLPPGMAAMLKLARSADGAGFVTDSDAFFQQAVSSQVDRPINEDLIAQWHSEMGPIGSGRRAWLTALETLSVAGKPAEAAAWVKRINEFLKRSDIPKLLVLGKPGYLLTGRSRELAAQFPKQTITSVEGKHLLPVESPDGVGLFLSLWLKSLPVGHVK